MITTRHRWTMAFAIASFLCQYSLFGQTTQALGIEDAVKLGLDNSKMLKISLSHVREAEAATQDMKNNRLPDVDLGGQYLRINEPNVSMGPLFSGSEESEGSAGGSAAMPQYVALGQASVSLPLFAGFRLQNGVKSAEYLQKAAQLDSESEKEEVIFNIVSAYYNLYKAQQAVSLVEKNLETSKQRVRDFTEMEKNGILAQNDLLRAQLQESNASLTLINAQNNLKTANYNMVLMLGLDESTTIEIDTALLQQIPASVGLDDLKTQALTGRNDLLSVEQQSNAAAASIKMAQAAYWPSVALTGGYIAADIDNALTVTNALNVGLGLSFNLSDIYKAKATVSEARERHTQADLMHAQLQDQIKLQVFRAYNDYKQSLEEIRVYETSEKQASENYRITKNKHDNSLATTTDLLDADVAKLSASLNYAYAKADAVVAYYNLLKSSGNLEESSINE